MAHRVVLVDDSDVDLLYTRLMFQRSGLDVALDACETADDALALLDDGRPVALLLMDISMPAMDGFELLAALAQRPLPPPPVVVLSSSPTPTDEARARAHPIVRAYLTKPVTPAQLRDVMTQLGLP